ncbi:MAG: hypothetical protein ACREH3_08890, partial [Geminicoccales bacterium]
MELRIVIVAVALAVAGLVLAALSATALGAAKAADKWPSAERPAMGEKPAAAGVGLGAILCGAAAGFAASAIPLDSTAGLTAIVVVAAAAALAAGA